MNKSEQNDEDFCNDPKCVLNREGEKHLKSVHHENFYKSLVKKKKIIAIVVAIVLAIYFLRGLIF